MKFRLVGARLRGALTNDYRVLGYLAIKDKLEVKILASLR